MPQEPQCALRCLCSMRAALTLGQNMPGGEGRGRVLQHRAAPRRRINDDLGSTDPRVNCRWEAISAGRPVDHSSTARLHQSALCAVPSAALSPRVAVRAVGSSATAASFPHRESACGAIQHRFLLNRCRLSIIRSPDLDRSLTRTRDCVLPCRISVATHRST